MKSEFTSMLPNQPDNTQRLSKKQEKRKVIKKAEISQQLKLTFLRDKLLDLSLLFLTTSHKFFPKNQPNRQQILQTLLGSLNEARFKDVCEERTSLKLCCNFFCEKPAQEETINKARTLRFILSKEKGCQKVEENDTPIAFCDGTLASKNQSNCRDNYQKIQDQVKNMNEGGPFGTPMQNLAQVIRDLQDHESLMEFDKLKIQTVLQEFDLELRKVSTKITEKNGNTPPVTEKVVQSQSTFKMNVISNRKPVNDAPKANLEDIEEEKAEQLIEEIKEDQQIKEIKNEVEKSAPLADDNYLSSKTLDYLDDIFADDQQYEVKQPESKPLEKPVHNPLQEAAKKQNLAKLEEKEEAKYNPDVESFLQKSVVKKKVKFSNEEEVASAEDQEDDWNQIEDQDFMCKSGSGVNQFQDMLEAEVKKQELQKERSEQAAAEEEVFEHDPLNYQEEGNEDSYDSEYDDEIFQPDDSTSIRKDIDAFLQTQSSFQKVQLICIKLTNIWVREFIQNKGKFLCKSIDSRQVEARSSTVKQFFIRQLKVKVSILLNQHPKSEMLNNQIGYHLQRIFNFIDIQVLTVKLGDEEWDSITKIMIKSIESLVDQKDDELLKFINEIELSENDEINLKCFRDTIE